MALAEKPQNVSLHAAFYIEISIAVRAFVGTKKSVQHLSLFVYVIETLGAIRQQPL